MPIEASRRQNIYRMRLFIYSLMVVCLLIFSGQKAQAASNYDFQLGFRTSYTSLYYDFPAGSTTFPGMVYGGHMTYIVPMKAKDSKFGFQLGYDTYNHSNSTKNQNITGSHYTLLPRFYTQNIFAGVGLVFADDDHKNTDPNTGITTIKNYNGIGLIFDVGFDLTIYNNLFITPQIFYNLLYVTDQTTSMRAGEIGFSLGIGLSI